MKKCYTILLACFCTSTTGILAQNTFPSTGSAGIGTTAPNASSILELKSTTKGFLAPRMTKAQRNAIAAPAVGLMIYQTNNTPGFYYYNGGGWVAISAQSTIYTAGQGISIANGVISNLGDLNAGDDITMNTTAGGDLVGNYPSPQVAKLQGITLYPVAPTTGQVLKYNGSYWIPSADVNTTYSAGNGLKLTDNVFTNTAPDQTVTLTGNGATTVNGTYPNFTISSTDKNTTYTAGTGIDITGTTITNTAPSKWNVNDTNISYIGGNVGIGISSPQFKLDVSGDINFSANSTLKLSGATVFKTDPNLDNVYIGLNTGANNTIGFANTAAGVNAFMSNADGFRNTAFGYSALYSNIDGLNNTATGYEALYSNVNGNYNIATGYDALYSNLGGDYNTANGVEALHNNTSGHSNTAVGGEALYHNTTGFYNTGAGYAADIINNGYFNTTVIGHAATGTASNQVRIGDGNITSIGGSVDWSVMSDGRVKKNIKENVPGLTFINRLKPVTYNLNLDAADRIIQRPAIKGKDGKFVQPLKEEVEARSVKMQVIYTGFVAQEVEKAAKSLNYDFSGVDAPKNNKDLYGLRYAEFVVPLVKAVQELSKLNEEKDVEIKQLKTTYDTKINTLQHQIDELKTMLVNSATVNRQASATISSVSLEQNIPNPFSETTTINYTLPAKYASAKIMITDKLGKTLKEINISGSGNGSLKIDAATLTSGAYQYSLYVNNKLIATKQMVLQQ